MRVGVTIVCEPPVRYQSKLTRTASSSGVVS
jgi:hypothetical protein